MPCQNILLRYDDNIITLVILHNWWKVRSQTSDSMDRWKSRGSKSKRREEQKRKDQRRERVRRKKMQVRGKVEKSRFTVFFQWFVAPEGRKVGSLKRRVRSHLARWEMKNCTPLWREAHLEVKSVENWRVWATFGSWDVEKVHAGVARSTFPSQNVKTTTWLGCSDVVSRGRPKEFCTCQKWAKREGFLACPKTMAGVGIRRSGKMHVPWQAQYKRHVHQRC